MAALGDLDARRNGQPETAPGFQLGEKKHDRVPKDVSKTKFDVPDSEEFMPSLASDTVS